MPRYMYIVDNGEAYSDWGIRIFVSDIPPATIEAITNLPGKPQKYSWGRPDRSECCIKMHAWAELNPGSTPHYGDHASTLEHALLCEVDLGALLDYQCWPDIAAYLTEARPRAAKELADIEKWQAEAEQRAADERAEAARRQAAVDHWRGVAAALLKAPPLPPKAEIDGQKVRIGPQALEQMGRWAESQNNKAAEAERAAAYSADRIAKLRQVAQ